jgi:hypothetical protein
MKRNRTPTMRKAALKIALEDPTDNGLRRVNIIAENLGEPPYPKTTWDSLVKNEVPRVKKYPDFFDSHTENPYTWGKLKTQWPL